MLQKYTYNVALSFNLENSWWTYNSLFIPRTFYSNSLFMILTYSQISYNLLVPDDPASSFMLKSPSSSSNRLWGPGPPLPGRGCLCRNLLTKTRSILIITNVCFFKYLTCLSTLRTCSPSSPSSFTFVESSWQKTRPASIRYMCTLFIVAI